ncbi:hypothetical protein [Candidatus Thiosymbion oneisti]|uniref:hypothetical protein n=1 Tax=Candidatus Thiosymbion oneisti TaxID=589554 RepID=UPI000A77997D|nr:hypothetical protein [Candidatus Thiosymbion oneisti]
MREDTSKDPRNATARTRGTLVRWLGPLLITAVAVVVPPAFAVNHYILLFDGSGSVKKQHAGRDNLWQGKTGNNRVMARIVRKFVDKAIKEMPIAEMGPGVRRFDPDAGDILSFLIFHTDLYNPSYRPERLFLTNESLLQVPSLPRQSSYLSFDASARTGVAGDTIELKEVFRGHSPLIAATGASLPFLADAFRRAGRPYGAATEPVDNTYIIRITDGDYNTEASGADEHNVIANTAARFRKKQGLAASGTDDGFAAHRKLNKRINSVFDIGATSVDCAFPTHNQPNRFDRPFDCTDGAYDKVKGWGKGFLISYLSVVPKAPALAGLARTEKTRVALDTIYKLDAAAVRLRGTNLIHANGVEDPAGLYKLIPEAMEWRSDHNDWSACTQPEPDTSEGWDCNGGGPKLDFGRDAIPKTLSYRARYLMDFTERPDQAPLYPYARRLPWVDLPAVTLKVAPIEETLYELPRDPESMTLSWLNPKHLLPTGMQEFPEHKIDAEILKRQAPTWTEELTTLAADWQTEPGVVTPRMLARISRAKKDRIEEQESSLNSASRLFYFLLLAVPAGLWFAWPRRKLEASVRQLVQDELVLDFNDRTHERTVLVAMVQLRNLRRNPTYTAGFKRIAAGLRALPPSPVANADTKALMLAESAREAAPFGLGGPHQYRHEERRPASGRELPVFFDPTEIRDLDQIAGAADAVFALPAEIDLDAHRAGKETLSLDCRVKILPETGRLEETCDGIELDADGHRRCRIEYKAGQHQEPLCTYRLESSAKHRYSRPVKGELKVLVHDLSSRPLAAAVRLIADDQPLDRVDFYLRYQDPQEIRVLVDFTRLANPIDQDTYRVSILKRKVNDSARPDGENQDQGATDDQAPGPWETLDEWNLIVERSTQRTEVSMLILENERHHSVRLNAARSRLDTPFPIGTESHPRPIMPQAQTTLNQARLFTIRLANACRNGHGHADWQARLQVEIRRGLQFPTEALRLVDRRSQPTDSGTLRDSPDSAAREINLGVELDLGQADFTQRDAVLEIGVTVIWTLYKKELGHPNASERIENSARVICYLRHQPPRDVLAIDFGTSALAIAHAAGPSGIELLPLPRRLTEIEAETKFRRRDDLSGRDSHFLASELNVCIDPEQLARTRPDAPDFLDLPLLEPAVYEYPDKCFSSLKALISAGFTELPLDARQYPYLNQEGKLEHRNSPPLDQVIAGAYRGLVRDFIEPILDQSNQGYSHVYVTHPNSYTQNHVRRLQNLVEQVFSGIARDENLVYPDNIHFVSESDAVAYYYLIHAHRLRAPGTVVPDRERILVYDIGAGTLDLTYLEVDWQTTNAGDYTPKQIRVRRRGGVTKAGDLLDECIARDLHTYLTAELDRERYLMPIVVTTEGKSMDEAEMRRMGELRR